MIELIVLGGWRFLSFGMAQVTLLDGPNDPARFAAEPSRLELIPVPTWILVLIATSTAIVSGAVLWRLVRQYVIPVDHAEAAFIGLARNMKIGRAGRAVLRQLAQTHPDATPAALLISEHAFSVAVGEFLTGGQSQTKALEQVRVRLSSV